MELTKPDKHKWIFRPRFRAGAFGWRSQPAITRVKEAVSEIRKVARKDPTLGAEGAVLFLEKISPALERVDSSSGAIGSAVNNAIDALVPIIVKAPADDGMRDTWLERLWSAYNDDDIPYIELLADSWGELCVTPERASRWADDLLTGLRASWADRRSHGYFNGTPACLSSLLAAGRCQELLDLLDTAPYTWWHYRRYGVQALAAMGRIDQALKYAEEPMGLNDSPIAIAQTCEEILLRAGRMDEAYRRFAILSNQRSSRLNTFRAIAGKYPDKDGAEILMDLIGSTPGAEGKWFATAKDLKLYDLAVKLSNLSPCEPRTLNRAARDHMAANPEFALESAIASIRWLAEGWGYEITALDIRAAFAYAMEAAGVLGLEEKTLERLMALVEGDGSSAVFVRQAISPLLPAGNRR